MDGATLSRFPHLSWLHFGVSAASSAHPLIVNTQGACHTISLTASGHHDVRLITRAKETRWTENVGTVHFFPADGEHHTFLTAMSGDFASQVLLLPRGHLKAYMVSEECEPRNECHRLLAPDDCILRACVARVFNGTQHDVEPDGYLDEAARRLIVRLVELCGGGTPVWRTDDSTFPRRTLADLVDYIQAHLRIAPSLSDMAMLVGLSPSHFAKKFRASTGLSLHRFINRRRLDVALQVLRSQSQPLASLASDLGFSSQSHFTRLFSDLTGMTPAKYRKHFARTVG